MRDEQRAQGPQVQAGQTEAKIGAWGPMSDEHRCGESIPPWRQAVLDSYLHRWDEEEHSGAGHGKRNRPFDSGILLRSAGVEYSGTDVFYLASLLLAGGLEASDHALAVATGHVRGDEDGMPPSYQNLSALHLEGGRLQQRYLTWAGLG